jgi:flavin-dependent dehydrogenase
VSEFDVAIIGGGPAGSAAALTLLRYSKLRPVILERSSYDTWRVGETLSPGVFPLLSYLGAESVLTDRGQRRAYATSAAWGSPDVVSRDFLFTGGGDAWHLDRTQFDASLAQIVAERGGTVMTGTPLSAETALQARYVIDATGRHAAFARTQGAHATMDDHLTGLVGIFEGGKDAQTATMVEAVEDGWWYSARLPENRIVVAFMTDADIVRAGHLHERETWLARLDATRRTRPRVSDAQLVHGPIVCPAHSQILDPVFGEGWIAAGEAAVGFDPLSSMGIGYAITSGIQAARIAANTLGGNTEHARLYASDVRKHYDAYLARRRAYYAIEKRWPESAFWERRRSDTLPT